MIPFRFAILAACLFAGAADAAAAQLHLAVSGLRSADGDLRVALFRTPEDFPKSDGLFREAIVPSGTGDVDVVFDDVPPGTYAVAAFHDENGNGHFDKGLFGFPLEGFGFANDAPVVLGPPDFIEAAVAVNGNPTRARFSIRYWFGDSN